MEKYIVTDSKGRWIAEFAEERPAVLFLNYILVPFYHGMYRLTSLDGKLIDWDLYPED